MRPEELAALEREEPVDCPTCGWIHRPSMPHIKTKWRPEFGKALEAGQRPVADPYQKFKEWEDRAKANPIQYAATGKKCPYCGVEILGGKNFLGIFVETVRPGEKDEEHADEHLERCKPKVVPLQPEDIKPPRRVYDPGGD